MIQSNRALLYIRKTLFILLMFTLSMGAFAATKKVTITGIISCDKKPIQFATVALYSANKTTLLGGAISDEKGSYHITVGKQDSYLLVVSSIGFQRKEIPLKVDASQKRFSVALEKMVTNIGEVQVKGSVIQNKIDRDVILVTKEMRKNAPSTIYLLRGTPGVEIDDLQNKILVNGNTNVLLLVDGVKKSPQYIKNMNSNRIDKMELFRDTNGRYAMEGYSAVVNVITKKNYEGVSAFMNDTEIFKTVYDRGPNMDYNSRHKLNIDYTINKFQFYTLLMNHHERSYDQSNETIEMGDYLISSIDFDGYDYNRKRKSRDFKVTTGVDYRLNDHHTLGVQYDYWQLPRGMNDTYHEFQRVVQSKSTGEQSVYGFCKDKELSLDQHSVQMTYLGRINQRSKLTVEGYYNRNESSQVEHLNNSLFVDSNQYLVDQTGDYFKMVTEWEQKLSSSKSFHVGYNYIWKHNENMATNLWGVRSGLHKINTYENERSELYHRFYGDFNFTLSKTLNASLGYAAQWSKLGEENRYELSHLPFALLMYKPNKKVNFILSYKANTINPFRDQTRDYITSINEYDVVRGNPDLTTALLHKASLSISLLGGKVRLTPYYSVESKKISQWGLGVQKINYRDRYVYSFINADSYSDYGVDFYGKVKLSKMFSLKAQGSYKRMHIEYDKISNDQNAFNLHGSLNYSNFKKGWYANLIYRNNLYHIPMLMGYTTEGNDNLSITVMKSLLKRKMNVFVYYSLPFGMKPLSFSYDELWSDDRGASHYQKLNQFDLSQLKGMVMLSVSYHFSKGKTKRKINKGNLQEEMQTEKPF